MNAPALSQESEHGTPGASDSCLRRSHERMRADTAGFAAELSRYHAREVRKWVKKGLGPE
jgi:hypothetical protein